MKRRLVFIILLFIYAESKSQTPTCFVDQADMKLGSLMPFTKVKVGAAEGYFVIDFGTTGSTIDPNGFINLRPIAALNSTNKFENFDFFGSWGTVTLSIQDHSNISNLGDIKQAGILGTDFLSLNTYMLDYISLKILRSTIICSDSILLNSGFKAASTAGYYSNNTQNLNNTCTANIPSVPIKIGSATAIAQVDAGFDDRLYRHSININQAFYKAITESGVNLIENPLADFTLSTCVTGVQEHVKAYKLPNNVTFSITGVDGNAIVVDSDVNIFLKQTPIEAKSCGGIGAWTISGAQLGTSFLIDSKKVIFDPFNEKVWFQVSN